MMNLIKLKSRKCYHFSKLSLLIFLFICFRCSTVGAQTNENKKATSYSITFDEDNKKLVKIKANFVVKDSILYMSGGASNLPKRWATFVHDVSLTNKFGQPIKIEEQEGAEWKIYAPINEEVILTYEVHLDHENYKWSSGIDAVAYTTDLGVFYTGRTFFILNGDERKNIVVSFNLIKNWKVTTPWVRDNNQITPTYQATNLSDLVTALLFAGIHREVSIKRKDFELVFALGTKDIIAQENEYKNLAEGVLDYYIELMGGIPNPSPDNPFYKSVVVISSTDGKTDGEAMGNNISVLIEKNGDQLSKTFSRFIFAHEFFHLWNGKSFAPLSDDTEWFKEGFTNYYTLKALHHIGFLDDASYLEFLSNFFYDKYTNDDGVGKISMTNGDAKHNHWGLVYVGGMFVGIIQDVIIRNTTNNKNSIDDLMKKFYVKYGGSNNGYSLQEIQNVISDLSGVEQTKFFESYVTGTNKIPLEKYLEQIGLNANVENGKLILSIKEQLTQDEKNMLKGFFGKLKKINDD